MRRWLLGVALGVGLMPSGPLAALGAPAVVSAIFAGTHEGKLELEIQSSQPLNYIVVEETEPFGVSLLFLDATFDFPLEERELRGAGLTNIRTSVLERGQSRLGRLDLTFGKVVRYEIVKEPTRILVRVDTPPLAEPLLLAAVKDREATLAAPGALRRILNVVPLISGEDVRVLVGANGPLVYRSFVKKEPFRVVVDFEQAQLSLPERAPQHTIEVRDRLLRRIRSSQFGPTAVRVVLDLTGPKPFWIEEQAHAVVIHLGAQRP